jgi:hypothetical protein
MKYLVEIILGSAKLIHRMDLLTPPQKKVGMVKETTLLECLLGSK